MERYQAHIFWSVVGSTIPDHDGYSVHLTKPEVTTIPRALNKADGARRNKEIESNLIGVAQGTKSLSQPPYQERLEGPGLPLRSEESPVEADHNHVPEGDRCVGDSIAQVQSSGANVDVENGVDEVPVPCERISSPVVPAWLDQDLVKVIREHAAQITYLNGSWPCVIM